MKEMEVDVVDVLLDPDNQEDIYVSNEKGRILRLRQIAVIPYEVKGEDRLYCVLKPIEGVENIEEDEGLVFRVIEEADGERRLIIEENELIAIEVFCRYYDLLKNVMLMEE